MKIKKRTIYFIIGLTILLLIISGGIFVFYKRKQKSQNSAAEEDVAEDEGPILSEEELEEWHKKDWEDKESGFYDYQLPRLSSNISEAKAKAEMVEAIWQWGGKSPTKQEVEKILLKNAQRINPKDKKQNYDDPLNSEKFLENLPKEYQQDIFSAPPSQSKFKAEIDKTVQDLFFLHYSFELTYKGNREIDWKASLKDFTTTKRQQSKRKTKAQNEQDYQKITDYLEKEINPSVTKTLKKFPSLTNLSELNQWTNVFVQKTRAVLNANCLRWYRSKEIGKKIHLLVDEVFSSQTPNWKTKSLICNPLLLFVKVKEEKKFSNGWVVISIDSRPSFKII